MNFLIVEDDIFFAKELQTIIQNEFKNINIDIFTDINNNIYINQYDVYFLDLEIGNKNGFDFAKDINQITNYNKPIIFVTSHVEFWKESFAYRPFWYVDKTHYKTELQTMFAELKKKLKQDHAFIQFEYQNTLHRIEIKDIVSIYKEKNYSYIQTIQQQYRVYISLKTLLKQMNNHNLLIKINSGTLVKKDCIVKYDKTIKKVFLKNKQSFVVSRSCKKDLREFMKGH